MLVHDVEGVVPEAPVGRDQSSQDSRQDAVRMMCPIELVVNAAGTRLSVSVNTFMMSLSVINFMLSVNVKTFILSSHN